MPGYEQRLCNFIENIRKKKRQSQTSTKSIAAKGESGLTKAEERELKKLIGEDIYD